MATGRLPDPNSSPLTAKGDLYTYSTVPAKLAVGNNGETLVADSSASQGLRWQGNYAAGKNAFINGDMRIWQRGTSFTFADSIFTADRFKFVTNGGTDGTGTVSQQTFTPGSAPVAGYEGFYYLRYNLTTAGTSTQHYIQQNIEDVRTFAGQTVTWSFWAKADSARVLNPQLIQRFGTGGSSAVVTTPSTITLSTSWARYSVTATIPSVSGKTIGTSSSLEPRMYWTTASGSTIEFWGWQLEAGNTATAFQTATGTLAGELAACQRYYFRTTGGNLYQPVGGDRKDPPTISDSEVRRILRKNTVLGDSRLATKKEIDFKFGDFVTILAGPFEGLEGEVAEINEEKMTVKVSVLVFGRSTPTEVPVDYVTLKNE